MDYKPNHIPKEERKWNIILSTLLIVVGIIFIVRNDLYIPAAGGKYSRPSIQGVHYHGKPLWIFFAAFLCAAANMLSVVLDHYDKRNNERYYRQFAIASEALGWTLLFLGIFLEALLFQEAVVV